MADSNLNQLLKSLMEHLDDRSTDPYSESLLKDIAESIQLQTSILKDQVVKDTEMIAIQKAFKNALSDMGIKTSTEFKGSLSAVIDAIKSSIKERGGQYTLEDISKVLSNLLATKIAVSLKMESRGEKGAPLSNVDSQKTEVYLKEIAQRMGADIAAINSFQERFLRFIGWKKEDSEKNRKERKAFGYQLLDALEKSKFIGGALRDTVRLFGLMGARWLAQFGPIGRWMGAIFYALSDVLGPFIVQGILKGVGSLFAKYIPMLILGMGKGIGGALMNMSLAANGPLADFATAGTTGQKLAAGARLGGAAIGAAALGTGAFFAGRESVRSFKEGDKVGGSAFGIGALGLGIAAIAALVAGIAAPVTIIAAVVGGLAVGVGAIWKNREKIAKWLEQHKELIEKIWKVVEFLFPPIKIIRNTIEFIKDHLPGWMKGEDDKNDPNSSVGGFFGNGGKGSDATLLKGKTDNTGHLSLQKMSKADWEKADTLDPIYGSLGEIKNLGSMSQKRAAEVIRADIAKKGNKSYYEIGDRSLVDKNQFVTDAADKDNVYFVRGTNARVRADLEKLRAAGYDTSQAKITAGIGTLGSPERMSPHKYRDSVNGHFGTTQSVDISAIYKDGRKATWGEYSKFLSPMAFGQTESDHEHWAYGKYKWMEDEEKAQKEAAENAKSAASMQNMMSVTDIVSKLPKKAKEKYAKDLEGTRAAYEIAGEDIGNINTAEVLKNSLGIHKEDSIKGSPWVVDNGQGGFTLLYDPTGNEKFTEQALQILANGGT